MKAIIAIGALVLLVSPAAFAGNKGLDQKQIYELKEKCSRSANAYIGSMMPSLSKNQKIFNAEYNYNVRLNTCLLLVSESTEHPEGLPTPKVTTVTNVIDVLKNSNVGSCGENTENGKDGGWVEGASFKTYDDCIIRAYQLINE